jgi:hypothetical protein
MMHTVEGSHIWITVSETGCKILTHPLLKTLLLREENRRLKKKLAN